MQRMPCLLLLPQSVHVVPIPPSCCQKSVVSYDHVVKRVLYHMHDSLQPQRSSSNRTGAVLTMLEEDAGRGVTAIQC